MKPIFFDSMMGQMIRPIMAGNLEHRLETTSDHDQIDVNIFLKNVATRPSSGPLAQVDDESASPGQSDPIQSMRAAAKSDQADLISFLDKNAVMAAFVDDQVSVMAATAPESFWITNAIGTRLTAGTIRSILRRSDVEFVDLSRHVALEE